MTLSFVLYLIFFLLQYLLIINEGFFTTRCKSHYETRAFLLEMKKKSKWYVNSIDFFFFLQFVPDCICFALWLHLILFNTKNMVFRGESKGTEEMQCKPNSIHEVRRSVLYF